MLKINLESVALIKRFSDTIGDTLKVSLTHLYGKEPMFNISITFILLYLSRLTTKSTKWHVRPAKSHQPGHQPSLITIFAVHMRKAEVLNYP